MTGHAARVGALSPQQKKILELLADGLFDKQIAHATGLRLGTVKAHVQAILRKLGVHGRTEAAICFRHAQRESGGAA